MKCCMVGWECSGSLSYGFAQAFSSLQLVNFPVRSMNRFFGELDKSKGRLQANRRKAFQLTARSDTTSSPGSPLPYKADSPHARST